MNYDRNDQLNPWLRGTWTSDYLPQEFFYKDNRFGRFDPAASIRVPAASILVLAAANSLTPAVTFLTTAEAAATRKEPQLRRQIPLL
jgi:hypothetical protein